MKRRDFIAGSAVLWCRGLSRCTGNGQSVRD